MSRMDSRFSNSRQDILYRFAYRLLGSREDALDVVQDVLEKLWKKRVHSNEKYHNPDRGALNINIYQTGLDLAFCHNGFHLTGDIIEAIVCGGGYLDGLLHELFHSYLASSKNSHQRILR